MDRKIAKELIHIDNWLTQLQAIARQGKLAYLGDPLLQEAGDSLMMKLGEASNRLPRLKVPTVGGIDWGLVVANRNFIIHQYDEIDREQTWLTLTTDLPNWHVSLQQLITQAKASLGDNWHRCVH